MSKGFGSRSEPTEPCDSLMTLLKVFFEKNYSDDKNHVKLPSMKKVKINHEQYKVGLGNFNLMFRIKTPSFVSTDFCYPL